MSDSENNQNKNYIDPESFFDETMICLRKGEISNRLGEMFLLLSERRINRGDFVRYVHIRDDLISIAVSACCKAFYKFHPYRAKPLYDDNGEPLLDRNEKQKKEKVPWNGEEIQFDNATCNNPYSFFSWCIHNAILQFLKKEYNEKNIMNKVKVESGLDPDYGYQEYLENHEQDFKFDVDCGAVDNISPDVEDEEDYYAMGGEYE